MVETDALDNAADIFGKARKHETQVAARRGPGDLSGFQNRDRPAPLRDFTGDGQAGQPGADHAQHQHRDQD